MSSHTPPFTINPPLLNSSNPWATTFEDLLALYDCPYTGAVTIRTSLIEGFQQHRSTHQYTFFSSKTGHATADIDVKNYQEGRGEAKDGEESSLNTLGYSPRSFESYVAALMNFYSSARFKKCKNKPFIISVSGTADEVTKCAFHLLTVLNDPKSLHEEDSGLAMIEEFDVELMMEINLSCPNIPDKPPPAYTLSALTEYITAISVAKRKAPPNWKRFLHVGIKTPPYTYADQFKVLIDALESSARLEGGCPVSFITAVNTLGGCLVLNSSGESALGSANGTGIGGMAGEALHPLALGNVKTIRGMLDASSFEDLRRIQIIGIGGVSDNAGYKRMRSVGAAAVGVGTALGREGVGIFEQITGDEL